MNRFLFILLSLFLFIEFGFGDSLKNYTIQKCEEYSIPHDIAIAIIEVESQWRNVKGCSGDIGIFQLNPYYINYYEDKFWDKNKKFNPWNPYHNIEMGIIYIKWLYEYYNNWPNAIMAFNIGPTSVTNNMKVHIGNKYFVKVVKVLTNL